MTQILIILQIVLMTIMIYVIVSNNGGVKSRKVVIDKQNKKEMDRLDYMNSISLTMPLTEKSRPKTLKEIVEVKKME